MLNLLSTGTRSLHGILIQYGTHSRTGFASSIIILTADTKSKLDMQCQCVVAVRTFLNDVRSMVATRGSQIDDVYLGWPIAPSYISPNAGGWGGGVRGLSLWVQLCTLGGFNFILFCNFNRNQTENDRYWQKINFLLFAKCLKMYSFFRICI